MEIKRILLVDDHAVLRQSFAYLLGQEPGLVIAQAGSLAEARTRIKADGVDIALVDLRLPDGSGVDLILELRQTSPRLPVLVLTISKDPAEHARALEAGAEEILSKEATLEEIVGAIERVTDG